MGLFSSKYEIYVSGGISRVRTDDLIINTTGLIVANASVNNLDIAEEIRLNELTGTKASYRSFWKKATKYDLVPTGTASYYAPNKEKLALKIRNNIDEEYPLADDLVSIGNHPVREDEWIKFKLQSSHNYTITTDPLTNNVLTYIGIDYYLNDYTYVPDDSESFSKFIIEASRNKNIETTVTKRFYVYYNIVWRVREDTRTEVAWTYEPAATSSSSDIGWIETADYAYDIVGDPWSLSLPPGGGTAFYHCHSDLCDPVVTPSVVVESVTFDRTNAYVPAAIKTVPDNQDGGSFEIANNYWSVLYVHLGRYYLWIVDDENYSDAFGEEIDVNDALDGILEEFAPVVATRNDFVDYTTGDHYKKADKALDLIGLGVDSINEAVSTDNPDIANIADTYVTLQSKLLSDHQDELGYNYAFFDKLREVNNLLIDRFGSFEDIPEILEPFDKGSGKMSINVIFSEIYSQRVSWSSITKTTKTGVLSKEYETTLIEHKETRLWAQDSYGTYTIRKRLTSNTYSEIVITRLQTEYFVYYDGEQGKSYKMDWDITSGTPEQNTASIGQLTIPVSLALAREAIPRELETFFLRTTHIGVFSRVIVEIKWYQQSWFAPIAIIASIVALILAQPQIAIAIQSTVQAVGLIIGITLTTYVIAILILAFKFAIIAWALKEVLTKALEATNNAFLRALIIIAYVYISYKFADTSNFSTLQQVSTVLNSLSDAINVVSDLTLKDINSAIKEFNAEQVTFDKLINDLGLEEDNGLRELKAMYLDFSNTFASSVSDIYTYPQAELASSSYEATVGYTSIYINNATNVDKASFFVGTHMLVNMKPSDGLLPIT